MYDFLPVFPPGARFFAGPRLALMYMITARTKEKTTADVAIWRNLSYTMVTGTLKYRAATNANKLTTNAKKPEMKRTIKVTKTKPLHTKKSTHLSLLT